MISTGKKLVLWEFTYFNVFFFFFFLRFFFFFHFSVCIVVRNTSEPRHDKTNKESVRPAKTQMPRLIWVFAGRTATLLVLSCRGSSADVKTSGLFCEPVTKQSVIIWAESSEFVSSSIPSWHILTAHAQPFRGARDLAFRLKVPLDIMLVWASSGGSGETARMRRLAWTFAARIGDKYQLRLTRPKTSGLFCEPVTKHSVIICITPTKKKSLQNCRYVSVIVKAIPITMWWMIPGSPIMFMPKARFVRMCW